MRHFRNKEDALNSARRGVDAELQDLHPTDKAEAYRTVEKEAGEAATRLEDWNERGGVPEREEDQGKTCIPDNNTDWKKGLCSLFEAHGKVYRHPSGGGER